MLLTESAEPAIDLAYTAEPKQHFNQSSEGREERGARSKEKEGRERVWVGTG